MAKKNILTSSLIDRTDSYLKIKRVGVWVYLTAFLALLTGGLIWMFLGSYSITVENRAQISQGIYAECLVPASDIDKIKTGQDVYIGNSHGYVTSVGKYLFDYEELKAVYGYSINRLDADENEMFYIVRADIVTEKTGYADYKIVIGKITPFEYFFRGKAE